MKFGEVYLGKEADLKYEMLSFMSIPVRSAFTILMTIYVSVSK
jgi:hypothetical protein